MAIPHWIRLSRLTPIVRAEKSLRETPDAAKERTRNVTAHTCAATKARNPKVKNACENPPATAPRPVVLPAETEPAISISPGSEITKIGIHARSTPQRKNLEAGTAGELSSTQPR